MTKKQLTKVLYVITKSNWYGAQKYTHKLATIIPRDHYDVSVAFGGGGVLGDKEPGLLKEKLEEARISMRKEREEAWSDIQDKERASDMSEDDKFRAKDDLQKIIDEANKNLEAIAEKKERELLS